MDKCCRKIAKVFNNIIVIWVVALLLCLALTGGAFLSIGPAARLFSRPCTISSNGDGRGYVIAM